MRHALSLALLLLPATASAQMFVGSTAPIPVARRGETPAGVACSGVVDGTGLTAVRRGVAVRGRRGDNAGC